MRIAPAVLSLALSVSSLGAQPADWRSFGPTGGYVSALAIDPEDSSVVYAGTRGGPFKSTVAGAGWRLVDHGIGKGVVQLLAIDPADPLTLFAAMDAVPALYRSRDGGESWQEIAEDVGIVAPIEALVTDPFDGSTVYFAYRGFYRSFDGGETWEPGAVRWSFQTLAVSPARPERLFATSTDGLHVSSDRGATWSLVRSAEGYRALGVDSADPDLLYVADFTRLFRSTDGGLTRRLTLRTRPGEDIQTVIADRYRPGRVFVLTEERLLESTDGGVHWRTAASPAARPLTLATADDGTVYFATECGVLRAGEGGTWQDANGDLRANEIYNLAADPLHPGTFYAATLRCGLFKSVDAGVRWWRLPGLSRRALDLDVDPEDPARLYAVTPAGVEASLDGGSTWSLRIPFRSITPADVRLAVAPSDPRVVYAVAGGGLLRSTDRGKSFSRLRIEGLGVNAHAVDVAVSPADADTVYLAKGALFKSTDGGSSWKTVTESPYALGTLSFDPLSPGTLYGLDPWGHPFRSVDDGESWAPASDVEPGSVRSISSLVLDPEASGTLYAGTDRYGVYVSFDGAETWQPLGDASRLNFLTSLLVTRTAVHAGAALGLGEKPRECDGIAVDGDPVTVGAGSSGDVAVDGAGHALLVWKAGDGTPFARALGAAPFQLGGVGASPPGAAADGPGQAVAVWQVAVPGENAIRVQRLGIGGERIGAAFRVDREPRRTKLDPAVAKSLSGEAVVAWNSVSAAGKTLLRVQRIGPGGAPAGLPITVRGGAGSVLAPAIAIDTFGRFAVVWAESQGQDFEVWIARYRRNGTARGGPVRLSDPASSVVGTPPRLGVAPDGETVVVWAERTADNREELVVRWLSPGGSALGVQRLAGASGFDVAIDRFDRALIVRGDGESGMRAQLFDPEGNALGEEVLVGEGTSPAAGLDLDGGAWVLWEDGGTIRARRLRWTCS